MGTDTVAGYTVYYYSDDEERTEIPVTDESYTYTISGLTNGVTYYVGVCAKYTEEDEYGVHTVDCETKVTPLGGTETAPCAPMITSVTATEKGSLTVNRTAPASDGGAVITGYEVDVVTKDSENGSEGMTVAVDADELSCTVEDLLYGTTYTVVVSAINAVGSADSDPVEVEVPLAANDIWVGGVKVTEANASDVLGDDDEGATVTYDTKRNTLTLDGFTYSGAGYENAGIYAGGELTIALVGKNEITCSGLYGIYAAESLSIKGFGSLEVAGSDYGIYAAGYNSTLLIDGAVVTAKGGDVASGTSYGIRANDLFTACNGAVVTAASGSAPQRSCGIYVYDTLNICEDAEVTATGDAAGADSYGIRTTDMFIDGGSFEATGGKGTYQSHGIWVQLLNVTDGIVKGTGGESPSGPSVGIQVNGWLTVDGCTVTATGGTAGGENDSIGIKAGAVNGDDGGIIVESGTVTAKSGTGAYTYGIQADNVTDSDGEVNAEAAGGGVYSWGIQAPISLSITGGKVNATGGNAENYSYGIQATDSAKISGADVTVSAGRAAKSYGIHSWNKLYFDHCSLAASAETAAVYAVNDITLYGAVITAPEDGHIAFNEVYEHEWHTGIFDDNGYAKNIVINPACVISFDSGDSDDEFLAQTVLPGGKAEAPISPKLDGYQFGGWYCYNENGEEVSFNFDVPVTEDITLHAKWNWVGPLYVGGVQVTGDNLSGDGWSYDIETATLTLTDATITGGYEYKEDRIAGIYAVGNLNIKLEGSNSITVPNGFERSYGIRARDDLFISGEGSLIAQAGDATTAGSYAYSTGIHVNGQLSISDANVTAIGGTASAVNGTATSRGVNAGGGLDLNFGGSLTANGGSATGIEAFSIGIDALGEENEYLNIAVYEGWLTAQGGDAEAIELAVSTGLYMEHCGLYVYENRAYVTLSGGSAKATSNYEEVTPYACSNGINAYAGSVGIEGGTVIITGGSWEGLDGDGWALYVVQSDPDEGGVSSGGYVNITCEEISLNPYTPGFTGTEVTFTVTDGQSGTVYAEGGIEVDDALTISAPAGGKVTGIGGLTDPDYYVIEDANGELVQSVTIEPLIYKVSIEGLKNIMAVRVPAGWSVNETYCERYDVDDFSEFLNPEKDGYTFLGFYTEAGEKYDFNAEVTGDITLTAKWRSNSSSGGGSSGSSTTTKTEKNEDGSTITTTTNKATGTVTEITKTTDGVTGTTVTDKNGNVTEVFAKVPTAAANTAETNGETVTLPVEVPAADSSEEAVEIKIDVPTGGAVVEIPVQGVTSGTVAIIVNKDGSETAVKKSAVTETGVALALDGDATVKVIDNSKEFDDVHAVDHWAEEAIDFVVAREIYSGTSETTFHPNNPMTRGMLAVVLHRYEDSPEHNFDSSFLDAAEGSWYEESIYWAAEDGIVSGYGNGYYGANDNIIREQLAVMLWRYAESPDVEHDLSRFVDENKISGYARKALAWANANGIINGKGGGILDPQGNATRAQVAQMLKNFITMKLGV